MTRRTWIETLAARGATLRLILETMLATAAEAAPETNSTKFTAIDCARYFTASPADVGPRNQARRLWIQPSQDSLIHTPRGSQDFRGIPFAFAPQSNQQKAWIALSRRHSTWATPRVEFPIERRASYVCLAQFCDWDSNEGASASLDAIERVGQHLADAILVYETGTERVLPIRRRFEVNSLSVPWGHLCFNAVPHRQHVSTKLTDPLRSGTEWIRLQNGVLDGAYREDPETGYRGTVWVCALENSLPNLRIKALRLEAKSDDPLMVCGITLYQGNHNPLRGGRLQLYRVTLPAGVGNNGDDWRANVDLGEIARMYQLPAFEPQIWLSSEAIGLAEASRLVQQQYLYVELAASSDAALTLQNARGGLRYEFDLSQVVPGRDLSARSGGPSVQVLEREKVWVRGSVVDVSTGRPTAVRLSFRSKEGRYIPPYGHRTEVNTAYFQDYGADVKLGNSSFAYIDGAFQIELPVGEVYLEMTKGFEYEPIRQKLQITPDQRELKLETRRFANLRARNWITADTHVHFLSPSTAVLEGQAEGLNLIHLLAAQWGDLFTNVGDISDGPVASSDGETVVWVGTENRQHILGHVGLLGGQGPPVFPMSASGPSESYLGDPLWTSLADWTDACRKRDGLAVAVHFPYPTGELAANIALNKIDAVEVWPLGMTEEFNTLRFLDWYRYLNCGYRLPAVSGTDKMGAYIAVGTYRTYANLGNSEFSFGNWAKAVRKGNTFITSGPLLLFEADGRTPGDEITLRSGGGNIAVRAEASSTIPVHRLEIVFNGKVLASRESASGSRQMTLQETVTVPGPGWLAARCASQVTSAGARIAAHTSPVYLVIAGQELFSAPVAAYMLTLIDGAETWVRNLATRPDENRFIRVLDNFRAAREHVHQRMHKHGIQH